MLSIICFRVPSLRVAGYGGSATVLWNALGVKNYVALKDIDPEAWELLGNFRTLAVSTIRQLTKLFHEVGQRAVVEGFFSLAWSADVSFQHGVLASYQFQLIWNKSRHLHLLRAK